MAHRVSVSMMRQILCLVAGARRWLGRWRRPSPIAPPFNRDIRPIMSDTCFRCHGPDRNARMAGMRLDIRDEATEADARRDVSRSFPAIRTRARSSQRIFADGRDASCRPAAAHKELTQAQKDTIRRWVAEGAVYEGHWAYQPVQRPAVPASRTRRASRTRSTLHSGSAAPRRAEAVARGRPPHAAPPRRRST